MPIRPESRRFYGYRWQRIIRPGILARDHYECVRCGTGDHAMCLVSRLHVAHLDGDSADCEPDNLATLCAKCHRAWDYAQWSAQYLAYVERKRGERAAVLEPLIRAARATLAGRLQFGNPEQIAAVHFLDGIESYEDGSYDADRQYELLEAS